MLREPINLNSRDKEMSDDTKETSFDRLTRAYKLYFQLMAILPFDGREFGWFVSWLLLGIVMAAHLMSSAMHFGNMIHKFEQGILDLGCVCEVVVIGNTSLRYALLLYWRSEYRQLFNDCRAIWISCTITEKYTLVQYEKRLRILFNFFFGSGVFINVFYTTTGIVSWIIAVRANNYELRVLPYKWFVDGVHESPGFESIFILQFFVIACTTLALAGLETAAPLLIVMNSGYFKTLQNRLMIVTDKSCCTGLFDDSKLYLHILECAKFHQKLLNLCTRIDKLTRTLFFIQFLGTGYNISLAGLKLIRSDRDKFNFIPIIILCFIQLLICQWAPDMLIEESGGVSMAAYFAYMPTMSLRTVKLLSIIFERAQRPVEMTAGSLIKLSLETFSSIITSAISFFTMLRNFNV